jgi:hypothetical protein
MSLGAERRWLLPAFIALGALCLFLIGSKLVPRVNTQAEQPSSTEGRILVIPIQIERENYGLAMVDTVGQTLWIYEINSHGPAHNRLRLLAARSWQYDRLLKDLNTAEPKPEEVKMMLEELGRMQKKSENNKQQDLDTNILQIAEPNKNPGG